MQRSRLGAIALGTTALLGAALASPALAAPDTDIPTFSEYQASAYQDADRQYIVNGDEPVGTTGDLKAYYDRMVEGSEEAIENGLVVNTVGGVDDRWTATEARNLTYCVSTKFGARYADIVSAMASGAQLWEDASAVDFIHVPAQDASCTTRNKSVVFSVEPVQTSQYIARAFFPSTPKRSRNVLIDDSIWTSGSWTPTNIIGHELGHTLGFRHEHTRPEAGTCFEDNSWRPLTPYDSSSIMHYPQCNGTSANLSMTATDRAGVASLYGA
ncbi:M57 family metalloprotease [Nocardioides renjunii]|uniref:M57 family metalloprotease n=1 Tax=Nocardioides renjunii TaxID=3095075 RepID=UPI002AFE1435|nr:M57 family metalloprotease [Nocardioides sp. S-34]WQQ21418.1 M57 family metalloprotease [Nocardioides sp. S-34]